MGNNTDGGVLLDLLIMLDATGSMGSYIDSAKNNIIEICSMLRASGRLQRDGALRVALLAYRDYPAKDKFDVVEYHQFTEDLQVMKGYLAPLKAEGGADAPEAFGTALEYAYDNIEDWRNEAMKAIIVVTDAAPHGINENGDSWPDGGPSNMNVRDPLEIANDMVSTGFSIFVLACEPTLGSETKYAVDFYRAISTLTLGAFCALTDSKLLATVVIGVVLERLDLKRLTLQYRNEIWKRIFEEGCSFDEVVEEVHKKLSSQGTQVTTMQAGNIYNDIPAAMENYKAFLSSESLAEARSSLQEISRNRHNFKAIKVLKDEERIRSRSKFFQVSICFKNTGKSNMLLQLFDSDSGNMMEELVVPNGHVMVRKFSVNIPINFSIVCERLVKNFSRTFSEDADIDVEQIFNLSS